MSVTRFWKKKAAPSESRPEVRRLAPPRRYPFGRHVAFTISEDSLQMAAASHRGTHVTLLDVRKHYVTHDDPEARVRALRQEIRRYLDEFGGPHPTVAVTLAGKETALRLFTLPQLSGAELDAAIAFEARRQMPFSVEDCWIDHQVIERITQGSSRQVRTAVLAATRSAVESQLAPFRELGIRVEHVYHTQDVVGQLLRSLSDFDVNRDYMLVDIHRRRTEISYYHGSHLQFFHVSSLGSSFLASGDGATVFEYFAESLATELQNSLDYFGGQFSGQQAHEVYVHGDLAYTDELISLLSDRVGFTFRRFPAERLNLSKAGGSAFEDDIAVCLPTVAAAVNQARIADLLPEPQRLQRMKRGVDRLGLAAMTFAAVLALGLWLTAHSELSAARENLAAVQHQVAEFQASDLFETCTQIKTRLAANRAYLNQASERKSHFSLNLKEMSLLIPDGMRLQTMEYLTEDTSCNLSLSGTVVSGDTPPEVILAEFVSDLARSPFYNEVRVDRHVKRREPGEFVLEFNLSMKAAL